MVGGVGQHPPICPRDMGHPSSGAQVQACFLPLAVSHQALDVSAPKTVEGWGPSKRGQQAERFQTAGRTRACSTHGRVPSAAPPRSMATSSWALPPPTSGLREEVSVHRAPGLHRKPPSYPDRVRRGPSEPRHPHPGVALQPVPEPRDITKGPAAADPVTLLCFKP